MNRKDTIEKVKQIYRSGGFHTADGQQRRGSSCRCAFWDGYNGDPANVGIAPLSLDAAYRRAGIELAKEED